MTSCWATLGEK